MNESQIMLIIIIAIFVLMAVFGYLFEEEEAPAAPTHEADHDHH